MTGIRCKKTTSVGQNPLQPEKHHENMQQKFWISNNLSHAVEIFDIFTLLLPVSILVDWSGEYR
jgi:hypothetical protein